MQPLGGITLSVWMLVIPLLYMNNLDIVTGYYFAA